MIGLVAIVLAFVLLGLSVVTLALRAGRKRNAKPTRRGQRGALGTTIAVAIAFGIGIPALVLAYNAGSQSKAAPGGVDLTAAQQHGRRVFAKNCSTCHTLAAANAVGKVGPNLDAIIPPIAEQKARIGFLNDAIANGRARGQGQMPKGIVDGTDQRDVAEFVAVAAGR